MLKDSPIAVHRVLLVEDNPDNQLVTQLMLESLGHRVDWVREAEAALERLSETVYDVVLLDVVLPGMHGIEFLRCLRGNTEHADKPWVVALTAHAMEVDEAMCRAAGANDYLPKPLNLEGLSRALARVPAPAERASAEPPEVDEPG
jgi:CheY-like chemotaxis protein